MQETKSYLLKRLRTAPGSGSWKYGGQSVASGAWARKKALIPSRFSAFFPLPAPPPGHGPRRPSSFFFSPLLLSRCRENSVVSLRLLHLLIRSTMDFPGLRVPDESRNSPKFFSRRNWKAWTYRAKSKVWRCVGWLIDNGYLSWGSLKMIEVLNLSHFSFKI